MESLKSTNSRRQLVSTLLLLLIIQLLTSCYTVKQGYYQGKLLLSRRPVKEVIADPKTSPETRTKLEATQRILDFARGEKLNVEDAYSQFVLTPSEEGVTFLVQAAPPYEMKLKTWWFPVVGTVPYLGFYHKKDRDDLLAELKREGLDVDDGVAEAFSSLGWFSDPVFSTFLKRSEVRLAHLLLHELVHRTLWVNDGLDFNENMAEALGIIMTVRYLRMRGMQEELKKFEAYLVDRDLYGVWLKDLSTALSELYKDPKNHNLQVKTALINEYRTKKLPKFATAGFSKLGDVEWNNASVLGSQMYQPDRTPFEKAISCAKPDIKIGEFLAAFEDKIEAAESAQEALGTFCI